MKKQLLTIFMIALASAAVAQTYSYSLNYVGPGAGPADEIYQLNFFASTASNAGQSLLDLQALIATEPGEFSQGTMVLVANSGNLFNNNAGWSSNDVFTVANVATASGGAIMNDKDIASISWANPNAGETLSLNHPAGMTQMYQFQLTRLSGTSQPVAIPNSDQNVINVVPFGLSNSFVTDPDGNSNPQPAVESYNENTASNARFSLNDVAFKAFPNPTVDFVNISNPSAQEFSYTVRSITGQNVLIYGDIVPLDRTQIDMTELETGVYFVVIKDGESTRSIKVIKDKR